MLEMERGARGAEVWRGVRAKRGNDPLFVVRYENTHGLCDAALVRS